MKIVCDNRIPFIKGVLEPWAEVVYLPGKDTTAADVRDADAIITRTRTICDEALLKGSKVKVIASATIGYDHIDTAWCESAGILWENAPGCNSWSVKQYVTSVLCALAQRHGLDLGRMTLGVVGVGNVGSKVAEAAGILGMEVLLNDPPRARREGAAGFCSLQEIIERADIITLHVPLTKEGEDATWHLFDAGSIAAMGKERILINSSRGAVVDGDALKAALASGRLKAAVLDTWEKEPDIDRDLLALLDIATPHIAGYSADGKANGTAAAVHTVSRVLGLPLAGWKPADIPQAPQPAVFTVDAAGKTCQEVISEAVLHTYDPSGDDALLRNDPAAFESLRGSYPVRREFTAFSVRLENGTPAGEAALSKLGFKII